MRSSLKLVFIISVISIAHQSDYKVLKVEKCYGDNTSIAIKRCEYINGYLLNVNLEFVKPIDFLMVNIKPPSPLQLHPIIFKQTEF